MADIIAVVTDLFFQVRISSAAKAAGQSVRFVGPGTAVPDQAVGSTALVDLDAGVDVPEIIRRLKAAGAHPVVAFGPHLDVERRKQARAAGADRVLAKSKFSTELPRIMASALKPPSA